MRIAVLFVIISHKVHNVYKLFNHSILSSEGGTLRLHNWLIWALVVSGFGELFLLHFVEYSPKAYYIRRETFCLDSWWTRWKVRFLGGHIFLFGLKNDGSVCGSGNDVGFSYVPLMGITKTLSGVYKSLGACLYVGTLGMRFTGIRILSTPAVSTIFWKVHNTALSRSSQLKARVDHLTMYFLYFVPNTTSIATLLYINLLFFTKVHQVESASH